jgi:vacuolar-type H+-ATPase subunit C/Vma6
MLPLASSFEFIQAKAHGLRSRVYELDRLDDLCDLRTIPQLWHRLYPEDSPADHHELQRRLLADHVATLEVIRRHLPERLAPLYTWMMRRYQIENLKVLLRAWKAHEPVQRVLPFLAPGGGEFALDAAAFLAAPDLSDFLLLIPESDLRSATLQGAPQVAQAGETFFAEAALDATYYTGLLERHQQLPPPHREGTAAVVHLEAAVYNILAVFRLKLNYAIPYEKARAFLVQGTPRAFELERLYDYPDFGDMLGLIPREVVRPEDLLEVTAIPDLEPVLWERLLHVANRQFYRSVGDLGAVVALYTVKRVELANLIRVIEGVRYGMKPTVIRRGLIRVHAPALR